MKTYTTVTSSQKVCFIVQQYGIYILTTVLQERPLCATYGQMDHTELSDTDMVYVGPLHEMKSGTQMHLFLCRRDFLTSTAS